VLPAGACQNVRKVGKRITRPASGTPADWYRFKTPWFPIWVCFLDRENIYFSENPSESLRPLMQEPDLPEKNLTERDLTERDIARLVQQRGLNIGSLQIRDVRPEHNVEGAGRADLCLDLKWEGRSFRFVVELLAESTPKRIRAAAAQACEYAKAARADLWPMVIAPYLSESNAEILQEEGASGVDLSGNYAVIVPGELFVVRTDRPNQFPSSRPIKKIYRGTSSLVGRVLLSVPEFETVTAVQNEIKQRGGSISLSTVSKVLKRLDEELVVRRDPTIRLLQPERLLDRLVQSYTPPTPQESLEGKAKVGSSFYDGLLQNAGRAGARVVGRSESLYTVAGDSDQRLTIYTTRLDGLISGTGFEETTRFANVELVRVRDDLPFFNPNEEEGFRWCPPLQIYLELMAGGKREQEIAGQIRRDLLERVENRRNSSDVNAPT